MTLQKQFDSANREIDKTAAAIAGSVKKLLDKIAHNMPEVARDYAVERLLLRLLHEHDMLAILDGIAQPGSATLKLSNALADYRDSRFRDR
jgi:hypothetical protein